MIARIFSCFLGSFVANGLARFGYIVLIPLMILEGGLSQTQSIMLGIAILVGYIFGSIFINLLKEHLSLESIAKVSFFIIALSFFACALPDMPFAWAFIWRFLAGGASASLMILVAPLCVPYVKANLRASVSGLVFSGIGLGAVFSGFVLPLVSKYHLNYAWVLLGLIALFAFIWSLFTLKTLNPAQKNKNENKKIKISYFLWLLVISYSLNAIAYLPHTLFWADFLVRDLNFDIILAGASWAFFGIGAVFGSLGSGILGDKIGFKNAHIMVLLLKALSCLIAGFYFIFPQDFLLSALNVSVFLMGFTTTGNVVLTNAMALEIVGKEYFSQSSSFLTLAFGVFQAVFSFAFTYSLHWTDYATLFNICVILHILSALVLLPIKKHS